MTSQDTCKRCLTAEQERIGERTIKLRKKTDSNQTEHRLRNDH